VSDKANANVAAETIKRLIVAIQYLSKILKEDSLYSFYFNAEYYKSQDGSILRECQKFNISFLDHYLRSGWRQGLNPSPYFSVSWYFLQIAQSVRPNFEPMKHYARIGWKRGLTPHPYFDSNWYLTEYSDVERAGIEPLKHFLLHGQHEGRQVHPLLSREYLLGRVIAPRHFSVENIPKAVKSYALSTSPKISVIVTNYNGLVHLKDLFDSLDAQTYRRFETIFVDDGSEDNSVDYAFSRGAKIVNTPGRVGFAKANNLGLEVAKGELVALVNNDMRLDPNCFERLRRTIDEDPQIGAVAPLIRFWSKFRRFELSSGAPFVLDATALRSSLSYKKYFVRAGADGKKHISALSDDGRYTIVIDIPVEGSFQPLTIGSVASSIVSVKCGVCRLNFKLEEGIDLNASLDMSDAALGEFFIVNNAGSQEYGPLEPGDRGLGQIDSGQFGQGFIEYFCGGAVLLRRDALLGNDLFISELEAYYEDSELSVRLRSNGFLIKFEPEAIVYHRHSASHIEHSAFWRRNTFRNRILFKYICSGDQEREQFLAQGLDEANHLLKWAANQSDLTGPEKEFFDGMDKIKEDIVRITNATRSGAIAGSLKNKRVGIYNSHWNTKGGGEAHILNLASIFEDFGSVDLISEEDFSIDDLSSYFGVSPSKARKRIVRSMTPPLTAEYDIFVNSSFQNEVHSDAKQSFYVVSFPSKTPSEEFLKSYTFLFNSGYTKGWAENIWRTKEMPSDVIFPAVKKEFFADPQSCAVKSKTILSVGRFASSGHTKNQIEIVQAFNRICQLRPDLREQWKLVLVGTANDSDYLAKVAAAADPRNVFIRNDCTFEEVVKYYHDASIYVHASGYGRDEASEPELFEHFGMAVAQAAASGCMPIIYNAAGPKEICDLIGDGLRFETVDELVEAFEAAVAMHDKSETLERRLCLVDRAHLFSLEELDRSLRKVLMEKISSQF